MLKITLSIEGEERKATGFHANSTVEEIEIKDGDNPRTVVINTVLQNILGINPEAVALGNEALAAKEAEAKVFTAEEIIAELLKPGAICPYCNAEASPTDTFCGTCSAKFPIDIEGMMAALLIGKSFPSDFNCAERTSYKKGTIITAEITEGLCTERNIYMAYDKVSRADPSLPRLTDCWRKECPGKPFETGGKIFGKLLAWPQGGYVYCEFCGWEGRAKPPGMTEQDLIARIIDDIATKDIRDDNEKLIIGAGETITEENAEAARVAGKLIELTTHLGADLIERLTGQTAGNDIYDDSNNLIIGAGKEITEEIAQRARNAGRLLELSRSVLLEG